MIRTYVRVACAGLSLAALTAAAGCQSVDAAQPANPLVPANTARGTADKAGAAVKALQNQVDQ